MVQKFEIHCVCGKDMFTISDEYAPQLRQTFLCEGKNYRVVECEKVLSIENASSSINYYVCVVEPLEEDDKVFVVQVKFIQGDTYNDMEQNLNKFLYENRHEFEILSIEHNMSYVAIKYRKRNKRDYLASVENEKSYRMK